MAGFVKEIAATLLSPLTLFVRGAALAAPLVVLLSLWGCTAEPTSQAPPPQGGRPTPPGSAAGPSGNHAPVVRMARIFPVDITVDTVLQVDLDGEDVDGDRITYQHQWIVNGVPIPGATTPQFAADKLKSGDRVAAAVTPNDGKINGAVFTTEHVTVGNTAPDIAELHLEPVPVHRGELLKVKVVAGDPDGDPVVLAYKWLRNDKEIPGAKTDTLDTKDFRKKDVLAVLVTPSDGKSTREPRAGLPVTIENAPPSFTSTPPAEIKDGQYSYAVQAVDPDGDPVTFELKQAPPGMMIEGATGKLTWKLTPDSKGKHRVVIVAKDNDNGVAEQEFELDAQLPQQATGTP